MRAPFSVVIITGASSGLGASLAKAYAAPHVALGLHGRDRQRLEATARACEALGATVNTAIIDVTDAPAMASWLREFDDRHPVDLLIANAGTSAGPDPNSPSEGAETAAAAGRREPARRDQHRRAPLAGTVRAQARPRCRGLVDRRLSGAPLQSGVLCEQSWVARLRRGIAASPRASPHRCDRGLSGVLRFAHDRSVRRADAVSAQQRWRCSDRQAWDRSRTAARRFSAAAGARSPILRYRARLHRGRDLAPLPLPNPLGVIAR